MFFPKTAPTKILYFIKKKIVVRQPRYKIRRNSLGVHTFGLKKCQRNRVLVCKFNEAKLVEF